ncbi:MAG: hypothetical protein KDE19_12940 [Caldilineaceae bacterium]|nr:hypothetical protein [Caldilineaceae bacterium]
MNVGFPQNRRQRLVQCIAACGALFVLLFALIGLWYTTDPASAKPIAQLSPLSPLPTESPISSAAESTGEREESDAEAVEAETIQPESPLPTDVMTSGVTLPDIIVPELITSTVTPTVMIGNDAPMEEATAEPVTDDGPPAEVPTSEPATAPFTTSPSLPTQPLLLAEPTTMTEMVRTGQVSLVLVGALFIGLLTTIGLLLTRR